MLLTILGGSWHQKVVSFFLFWRPKCHFFEIGHFCQKCPFSCAKKWHFGGQNKKMETTFCRQLPPKMVYSMFVFCVYHFWVGFKPIKPRIFENSFVARFSYEYIRIFVSINFQIPTMFLFDFYGYYTTLRNIFLITVIKNDI